jgi:FkbM family methyltransferase
MKALRHLAYRRELRSLAHFFGLSRILRNCYYRLARPRDGILRLEVHGIIGEFRIHAGEDLRFLEAMRLYEDRVLNLMMKFVKPGDVVYDVGANAGLYTVLLGKAVGKQGKVIAFEPQCVSFDHLQDNLMLNGLTNVRSFRKALGDRSGKASLYLGECGNLSLVPRDTTGTSHEIVDLVEGDRMVEVENLPLPKAIKIDVEGYEYAVLSGLRRSLAQPACELICCEVHPQLLPAQLNPEMLLAQMKSLGFTRISTYPGWHVFHAVGYKSGSAASE